MSEKKERPRLSDEEIKKIMDQTTVIDVAGNLVLGIFKLFAGFYGHSTAMISDAIHTMSDVIATLIAWFGLKISKKGADEGHPYGHDRYECIAALALGLILIYTGFEVGKGCVDSIVSGSYKSNLTPGIITIVAAVASIASKEGMYWYTIYQADRMNSTAFRADAWHHRSDALSSVGALIGIIGARMGYPIMDVIAGIIICLVIVGVGCGVIKDAFGKMIDSSMDAEYNGEVQEFIKANAAENGFNIGIDSIITRKFGEKHYMDLEISADGNMSLKESHDIAEEIHNAIEKKFPDVKHVMVHMNPAGFQYTVRG